jgi:hypothetical protein
MVMRWITGLTCLLVLPVFAVGFLWSAICLAFNAGFEAFEHYADEP